MSVRIRPIQLNWNIGQLRRIYCFIWIREVYHFAIVFHRKGVCVCAVLCSVCKQIAVQSMRLSKIKTKLENGVLSVYKEMLMNMV